MQCKPHNLTDRQTDKKRIEEIDIVKALGIICMVAGHSGAPFTHFIYLFHMAIFFMASGFFFKDVTSNDFRSVINTIKRKLLLLWLPFFAWNAIYVLLHNLFIKINVYTDDPRLLDYVSGTYIHTTGPYSYAVILKQIVKGIFFSSSEQMFGASWFLRILFMVSVCYLVADYIIKKLINNKTIKVQLAISAILLTFGYICYLQNKSFHGIAQTASFYCLYYIGYLFHIFKTRYVDWDWKRYIFILLISFFLLLYLNTTGSISLGNNSYENPFFLLGTSIIGWVFLYSMAFFLKKISIVKNLMLGIGKRTLSVVILHFLSFKIVAAVITGIYHMPSFCIAAFPNLHGNKGLWWAAYTVVGVGVPITANIFFKAAKDKVLTKN